MTSHFFIRTNTYPTRAQLEAAIDELAELLASDRYSLTECARLMQVSFGTVAVLLRDLCHRYGEPVL
jgi:hypothetical protein